ncbi:hypothetical protein H9Q72_002650 [Fusarium xylarioides]|uniref:Extracellular membrane protein CFEM domain-containing protein n=1 Tax=Fusarium xylarioides TaxID=221167 RepID=A0A9P7I558_9HYPO|nr:hypothetical protein H9Q72_002650 [Fusarium xylarioides]KAG5809144.1 hypothetical protein H9Q71_006442 [Fusarium xylarioides]KAG5823164.1 hypothetical protein H9Q74_006731 [Fusarium xylarioides]
MRPHLFALPLLSGLVSISAAANTESDYLATVTLAPTASGAEAFDLEEKRAECFQACYETYGNYKSCTRGGVFQCWCNESVDWVEREEDCVWDICGPSAYNLYATVLRRVCETVTASASQTTETGSTSSDEKVASTFAEITSRSAAETTSKAEASQAQATETSTSGSDSTTTSSETAAAATSSEPNSAWKMGSSLGVSAALAIGAVYLARMGF